RLHPRLGGFLFLVCVVFGFACGFAMFAVVSTPPGFQKEDPRPDWHARAKTHSRTAGKKETETSSSEVSSVPTIDPTTHIPDCGRPMYFQCLDGAEYDRGEWVFVKPSRSTRSRSPGVCKRWRPDSLCLSKSKAHFRKYTTCVTVCEERREKRCLQLVTEDLLRNCTEAGMSSDLGRYWYYDRIQRTCLAWSADYVCADNSFKSSGQCKNACLWRRAASNERK
ncbi:unnamed protein product, partial [Ixodes persulcatus]